MTNEIIVCATKHDPKSYGIKKYDNNEAWNQLGGFAPTGVSATKYLRKTSPDINKLDMLAKWLVENVPGSVAGNMPNHFLTRRVKCYNGKTEADMVRESGKPNAENIISAYGLEKTPAYIPDWLFPIIIQNETDIDYWNRASAEMKNAGVTKVNIGNSVYEV
ncbi:MAG: hypothetical protein ACT6FG_00480 [Methanosarcinaceae archaeon]